MRLRSALALALVAALVASAAADEPEKDKKGPKAEELVPFERLEVGLRDELWKVCQRYTVRRRTDDDKVACTEDTYEWLLKRLPIASIAARELELGSYVIEDKGEKKFSIDDTKGAFANCERIVEEKGRQVIVARGRVDAALLPEVEGTGVIVVRWRPNEKEKKLTQTECYVFFRVANAALHRLTSPIRDTLGKLLGSKLDGLVGCAKKVSAEIERDPARVFKALERSKKLKEAELEEFRKKFLLS